MVRAITLTTTLAAILAVVSAAPGHHGKHKDVHTGKDAGLININPGKHLLIDDIIAKHSLNHVLDVDLIKLKEVLKNVAILSNNGVNEDDF
ncbi:hypothetical protein BDF20DRAFT_863350 [Mycotypha africana]|uniref:uncharacterized protein n=1 Tax=Mycotypha africana TaxID=64632 RepID=UPI0022FFDBBF|nr:uncharacterized protein BDF20DRAFT_863350 [Mycotypha africana]KAI8981809.1 hypothetical protein BDF20DRAFT_863350 [Mycotypha africana]